jgi:hypothetical protein
LGESTLKFIHPVLSPELNQKTDRHPERRLRCGRQTQLWPRVSKAL